MRPWLMAGSTSYSIATVGCNLRCAFCQNWEISQLPKGKFAPRKAVDTETPEPICPPLEAAAQRIIGEHVTPQEIVDGAIRVGAQSIAYTYTEPTIFYELAYDTAVLVKAQGLKNIFVTNGFIGAEALRLFLVKQLDSAGDIPRVRGCHRRRPDGRHQPARGLSPL